MDVAGTPLAILVNPHSAGGRALKLLPAVEAYLDARRAGFRVIRTKSLEHGVEAALGAAEAGELPVVMSGDGLLGAIGGALADTESPLGIVPGGRGNDLARVLGIPTDPEAAIATVLGGHSRAIDVGEANGKRFLGIVSAGFDSECNKLANETRFLRGNLVYAYSSLVTLARWKPAGFTIRAGEETVRIRGFFVAVANNSAYGGGMYVAPNAELDDGEFDVVAVSGSDKLHFLRMLPTVFKGEHLRSPDVQVFRAPQLELSSNRPFPVYADGEHLTDLPVSLRVLPRALRVLVPRNPASQ